MLNWIHHLLDPHCPECKDDRENKAICQSCETLKHQLETVNYEKKTLLEHIVELTKPSEPNQTIQMPNFDEIKPRTIPWAARKQMLEEEDRKRAAVLKSATDDARKARDLARGPSGGVKVDIKDDIAELERELGLRKEEEG